MSPLRLGPMAAILFLVPAARGALALAAGAWLTGCSLGPPGGAPRAEPEWRLVPEGTALSERRQFFLYGRHLDSVSVSAPPSVTVEKGALKPGGRALSLYLTVHALSKEPQADGETPGARELGIKTADTALTFRLKVVDEILPR
jgi:hypothetical protein